MSLAMYAAPFENNNEKIDSNYSNDKKRHLHNKTQKKYPKDDFDTNKVNSVLETIHSQSIVQDDSLGDFQSQFQPPSMPQSTVHKPPVNEQALPPNPNPNTNSNAQLKEILGKNPNPYYDAENSLDLNNLQQNYGNSKTAEDYYKKYIPHYNPNVNQTLQKVPYHNTPGYYANMNTMASDFPVQNAYSNMSDSYSGNPTQDALMQKLNYMIHLLEEQQDERTNNVTEEVILYSFLGIFIIFIVDSFARVGKYTR